MKTNPFNILTDETFNEKKDIKNNLLRVLAEGEDELIVPDGWDSIQYLIRNNLHSKVFHVGDELICQKDGKEIAWTIIGIDEENIEDPQFNHSITLQTKDIIDENIPFDVREALFYFSEGLSVGTYYFTIKKQPWYHDDIGKSFMFTLENSIPVGGQLVIQNNYNETCAHSNINSYSSSNSIIPIEEAEMTIWDGETGIFLGNIDIIVQDNINSIERALKGSNNYKESFIRQWLNSNGDMNIIWEPQSIFDRLSSSVDNLQGFMKDLDEDFLRVVKKSNIGTLKKIITKDTTSIGFNSNLELSNYRIYGNTVDGEPVGDRTENLFDGVLIDGVYADNTLDYMGLATGVFKSLSVYLNAGTYTLSFSTNVTVVRYVEKNMTYTENLANNVSSYTFTLSNANSIGFSFRDATSSTTQWDNNIKIMLNSGSTSLPYEPFGYRVPVKVEGKNLLQNTATSQVINGVAITVNSDKSISLSFDSVSFTRWVPINRNVNVTTGYILNGCPNLGISGLALRATSSNSSYYVQDTGTGVLIDDIIGEYVNIDIRIPSNYANSNITFYPMIRKAGILDDTYESYQAPVITNLYLPEQIKMVGNEAEYIDYKEQKQHRVRKNLLKITYASSGAMTYDGVSISNNDGILTLNGTSINGSYVTISTSVKLPIGTYILTGASENLMLRFQKTSIGYAYDDTGAGRNFICPEEVTSGACMLKLTANYTYNSVKVYPMIRKSDITDDTYEPYIENTELDVELPALPTRLGTNILSVETEVKPSEIYLYQNTIETVKDYFFLPSKMQIYGKNNSIQNTEGNFYSYYHNYSSLFEPSDGVDINRIKYVEGLSSQWITRTEGNNNSDIYTVTENGELSLIDIDASYGVAPICIVY